jgi:hypothetical protein
MRSVAVHKEIVVGLGAAAGALAAAALFTTAPIASAIPENEYTNEFTIGEGGSTVTYETTWDGTGLPTTTTTTDTLPTGTEAFGFQDESSSFFTIGTTSFNAEFDAVLFDTTSAAGSQFEFVSPVLEFFLPAI